MAESEDEHFDEDITPEIPEDEEISSGMVSTESPPDLTTEMSENTIEVSESDDGMPQEATMAPLGEEVESLSEGNETMIEDSETPAKGENSNSLDAETAYTTTSPYKLPLTPSPSAIASEEENHWWEDEGNEDWIEELPLEPTENPTPRPTMLYTPMEEGDPLEEQEEYGRSKEDVFYHGLGGPVGEYLDSLESPEEMEKDHNVQVIGGVLLGVFLVLLLVTAHQAMNNPDGLCAGCCRLTNQCICCFIRVLCLPCRAICCKDDQSRSRRTHAPMRTPFPTGLELA